MVRLKIESCVLLIAGLVQGRHHVLPSAHRRKAAPSTHLSVESILVFVCVFGKSRWTCLGSCCCEAPGHRAQVASLLPLTPPISCYAARSSNACTFCALDCCPMTDLLLCSPTCSAEARLTLGDFGGWCSVAAWVLLAGCSLDTCVWDLLWWKRGVC